MGKVNVGQLGRWIILLIVLSACSDSVSSTPTQQPTLQLAQPTSIPASPTASPSATHTASPSNTPTTQATQFNGIIPTRRPVISTQAIVTPDATPDDPLTLGRGVEYVVSSDDVLQAMLPPRQVNDLHYPEFFALSESVQQRVQSIFARGQIMGRDAQAFTRIGDSTIEPPHFFYRFDNGEYDLGAYTYLQRTIDYYTGSYAHDSVGVMRGLHTWSVFDPMWSPEICDAGEHMLACEFRLHNPSVMIIRLGTNDRAQTEMTRESYENIVRYSIEHGVIPILGTKADRFDGEDNSVNTIIREIADQYQVPLWDFDLVASTLPDNGLTDDDVHLSIFYMHDWQSERGFTTGHGLHNLTGLIVLDELRQILPVD